MEIPKIDYEKFVDLFGEKYASEITYESYVNYWKKTSKEIRKATQHK